MSHADDVPERMQAVEISTPGGPDVLVPAERPVPRPGHGEILIKVAAAGVNRPDVFQRQGAYPPPPGASDLPGLEVAGTVAALGPGVTEAAVGDPVCALAPGGGYAEYCAVPAGHALPVPDGMSMTEAGALPETCFTVWTNVFERGALQAGEAFLVHGGASGIGTTAIQLAAAFGARVFATAGSVEKCALCEELGAERAINYREQDFVEELRAATAGRGVDLILDMVAGDYIPRDLKLLAEDGRLVIIAFLGGSKAQVDFTPVMVKRLTVTGSTLRPRTVEKKTQIAKALRDKVWPLIAAGRVEPIINATYPLARAAEAHALMESGSNSGKIVLTVA
jgi:putative PIG3 family NAD(P)H quinone oxidoreductase